MAYTTTVAMTRLWICERDNPTVFVSCGSSGSVSGGSRTRTGQVNSEFRKYGDGRIRQVSTPGTLLSHPVTLMMLTPPQQVQVCTWRKNSTQLLLRDVHGVRLFCGLTRTETLTIPMSGGLANIAVDLTGTSYLETV